MQCTLCGHDKFIRSKALWPSLIREWQLTPVEAEYLDRQNSEKCASCGAMLRTIALGKALQSIWQTTSTLVQRTLYVEEQLLEIDITDKLHTLLSKIPRYSFVQYPEVDIHELPFDNDTFDIVVHSDVLEHVDRFMHALYECFRVLKPGGALCFTTPIIHTRMSKDRVGLSISYHGSASTVNSVPDQIVYTEFGADIWSYMMQVGFTEVRLFSVEWPTAVAIVGVKPLE